MDPKFCKHLNIWFTVCAHCFHSGLIHRLQRKLALHGVKLSIPGLEGVSDSPLPSLEPSEPGLVQLLTLLCGLELNGNLRSELEQVVERERACLLQDALLRGLLDNPALRHCLDIAMENSNPGKIKVLEVRLERNGENVCGYKRTLTFFTSLTLAGFLKRWPALLPRSTPPQHPAHVAGGLHCHILQPESPVPPPDLPGGAGHLHRSVEPSDRRSSRRGIRCRPGSV